MEEWKDIKGYEGRYQVSNLGRVKSLNYNRTNREKILSLNKHNKNGYYSVQLSKSNVCKRFLVHRLVAESFIDNPNNYKEVNHKDENKSNNCVSNLEWCDRKYNVNYGTTKERMIETQKRNGKNKGSKNPASRKVQCITTGRRFNSIKEATEYYYIDRHYIINNCKDNSKYGGKHPVTGEKLIWKYID